MKLTMCQGLPGSGKTYWALQQVVYDIPRTKRVNKDDIRRELETGGWQWSQENEAEVVKIRDSRIVNALQHGYDVISDDTNFGRKHKVRLEQLARENGATFEIRDFTKVPVDECVRRDALREGKACVGERVIRKMAATYLQDVANDAGFAYTRFAPVGRQDPTLPMALICDLDGTLALFKEKGHRGPYDATLCADDDVNGPVQRLVQMYAYRYYHVIFLSGREDKYREPTLRFLMEKAQVGTWPRLQPLLLMRKTGDKRKDWIVKGELFDAHIRGQYYVDFVLDDRNQVVNFWRAIGLTCLQVADGAF